MGFVTEIPNNKVRATTKLKDTISSYLFEQQCGEMQWFTEPQKKSLEKVVRDLARVIKKANGR